MFDWGSNISKFKLCGDINSFSEKIDVVYTYVDMSDNDFVTKIHSYKKNITNNFIVPWKHKFGDLTFNVHRT